MESEKQMADTPNGETGKPAAPTNDATPVVPAPAAPTPVEPPKEDSEVAKLRKEKEQAEMRANQLQNQLKNREEAEAAAKVKEMEEQAKYKELFEQEKAKNDALITESEKAAKEAELDKAKKEVLADFSEEVRTLAEDLGLDLTDTDEATVAAYKEKLEKVDKSNAATGRVSGNNPVPRNNNVELSTDDLREQLPDPDKFHQIVTEKYPGIAAMTSPKR